MRWTTFCHAVFGFVMHNRSLRLDSQKSSSSNGDKYSPSFPLVVLNLQIMDAARSSLQKRGGGQFETLLLYMDHVKTTNPRDKVFVC